MKRKMRLSAIVVATLFLLIPLTLFAASPEYDYYKGKVITYIVATKPGGGYDAYARLIGKYMEKHIPGSTLIIKNVPGAGHIIGANETFMAKPDGLTIGTFNTGLIYNQIVGLEGIKFDLAKYSWIGKASNEQRVMFVRPNSPLKTLKEFMEFKGEIKMASSGVGSAAYTETLLLAKALDINLKAIPGYQGREGEMAMLRGEVIGQIASYAPVVAFINTEKCPVVLQIGAKKLKELGNVPLLIELKMSEKGKKIGDLMTATIELGRFTAAPPNTRPERLAVLREAYKKALSDPNLLKEAEKMKMDIDPLIGEEVAQLIKEAVMQPADNVALLKQIVKE
jgi:tripartite-type tricarboxylate transporter receptor subunit TctC